MVESSYYREPSGGKKGNKPSKLTFHQSKGCVNQLAVINTVKAILTHEFIDFGYRLMTSYLKRDGYVINHKKLYRIMKEEGLLKLENRIDRSGSGRKFVKFRKVKTGGFRKSFEYFNAFDNQFESVIYNNFLSIKTSKAVPIIFRSTQLWLF